MKHRLFLYLGLLLPLLGMAGCGGGGGGSAANPGDLPSVALPLPVEISAASLALFAGDMLSSGNVDNLGSAARFANPFGVAADSAGNIYVADTNNHTIRKITPAAVVTTLAGSAGVTGSADGIGAAASFNSPQGIATDSAGNVYVGDTNNHTIRKITPAGVVSTLAGLAGVTGGADGTGATARFAFPRGVAADGAGNVYVADTNNSTIRKITPAGIVTTLAGLAGVDSSVDGIGAAARLCFPLGVATDGADNVYVADWGNNTIRKITPAGVVTTLAGTAPIVGSADGTGAAASFNNPRGIATDSTGNVYVTDTDNHTVRKITPAGVVTTVVGVAGERGFAQGALPALLTAPQAVAVSGTSLYITLLNGVAVVQDLPLIAQGH